MRWNAGPDDTFLPDIAMVPGEKQQHHPRERVLRVLDGGQCRTRTCGLLLVSNGRTTNQQFAPSDTVCDVLLQMPCWTRLFGDTATLGSTR